MPKTRYTTVNGMLIGERTDSGNRIDYVPDALGSIVAAVDENLNTTYTAAYKPYGDVLASTGTGPRFTWVGTLGYLASAGVAYAEYSVRKRFPSSKIGRWTSVDPLWPREPAYLYVQASPLVKADPTGLYGESTDCCCCPSSVSFKLDVFTTVGNCASGNAQRSGVDAIGTFKFTTKEVSTSNSLCTPCWWECSNIVLNFGPHNTWNKKNVTGSANGCVNQLGQPIPCPVDSPVGRFFPDEPSLTYSVIGGLAFPAVLFVIAAYCPSCPTCQPQSASFNVFWYPGKVKPVATNGLTLPPWPSNVMPPPESGYKNCLTPPTNLCSC